MDELNRSRDALGKHYEALRRGPVPQEVALARAELALAESRLRRARVELGYRTIRAPISGIVVEVHRHAGDSVSTQYATPILRLADTSCLQIRLEVDEANVAWLREGLVGEYETKGSPGPGGCLTVKTIVPTFGPKRLFNPDSSARYDSRILTVICEPTGARQPLFLGQRVTAYLSGEKPWSRKHVEWDVPGRPARSDHTGSLVKIVAGGAAGCLAQDKAIKRPPGIPGLRATTARQASR